MENDLKVRAERYIRAVYEGQPAVLDELVDDEIVSSYPIFQQLFQTSALRGLEAVKDFSRGFSRRWSAPAFTVHETIAEDRQVVLVWSFSAHRVDTGQDQQWGGMTLVRFNDEGKVIAEIGEESTPGPIARWHTES